MKYQLEFYHDEKSPIDLLKEKVEEISDGVEDIRGSTEKVRKSMFAKHGELYRQYMELNTRMQLIERHICCQLLSKCELASM